MLISLALTFPRLLHHSIATRQCRCRAAGIIPSTMTSTTTTSVASQMSAVASSPSSPSTSSFNSSLPHTTSSINKPIIPVSINAASAGTGSGVVALNLHHASTSTSTTTSTSTSSRNSNNNLVDSPVVCSSGLTAFSSSVSWRSRSELDTIAPPLLVPPPNISLDLNCQHNDSSNNSSSVISSLFSSSPIAAPPSLFVADQTIRTPTLSEQHHRLRHLKGIVFDMDGTLTKPGLIDFKRIRRRIAIPVGSDIISYIRSLPPDQQIKANAILHEEEALGITNCQLNPGFFQLMTHIDHLRLPKAIVTRNSSVAVEYFKSYLQESKQQTDFSIILDRDFEGGFKPDPAPILHICKHWCVSPTDVLMVGDSADDLDSGERAGAMTCLIENLTNLTLRKRAHLSIARLDHLIIHLAQPEIPAPTATATAASSSPSSSPSPSPANVLPEVGITTTVAFMEAVTAPRNRMNRSEEQSTSGTEENEQEEAEARLSIKS